MKLILAIFVLVPQQEESVRERLDRLTLLACGAEIRERNRELARIANPALDELPGMIKEATGERRVSLLCLYGQIAEWKRLPRTPAVIINLARAGTGAENLAAARIAMGIRDERGVRFILDCLARLAAGERTDSFCLENSVLRAAGWSHSDEVGKALLPLIDSQDSSTRSLVIDALGTLGYVPAADRLKALDEGVARHSMRKIAVLTDPDPGTRLIGHVRGKLVSGEFCWYRWALDQVVHRKLTDAAPRLREEYDDFVKKIRMAVSPTDWPAELLLAIHTLGGKLSDEETNLLHDFGRLPAAAPKVAAEEPLVQGFAKSMWAPREERLKKLAAKNALPTPRIPEDKLPKDLRERIRFVMDLAEPDPSYLAPDAAFALKEIEDMLGMTDDSENKLLKAYHYLAGLREGLKTPDVLLDLAGAGRTWAIRCVTAIADDRAESFFLEAMNGRRADLVASWSGRLSSPAVKEVLLKFFRKSASPARFGALKALGDLGCVELIPELKEIKTNLQQVREALWKLEFLAAPDRDDKLLATAKSMQMSTGIPYYQWALDQIVRLDLKKFGPELRTWYEQSKAKWGASDDPYHLTFKMPWILLKLGDKSTPEEEELLRRSGRRP